MVARGLFFFAVLLCTVGCDRSSSPLTSQPAPSKTDAAVVPQGFDQGLLEILRCPENLTALRLATQRELDAVNERIEAGTMKSWGGKAVKEPVAALLIRADGKIGYRFQGSIPVMIIEEALVLDETVGKPAPDK